jgi:predicted transcriptional regulator
VDLFTMEYVLAFITLGSVYFLLQILMDFNRNKEEIRPQVALAARTRIENQTEIEKVEHLVEELLKQDSELQKQLDELDAREEELRAGIPTGDDTDSK